VSGGVDAGVYDDQLSDRDSVVDRVTTETERRQLFAGHMAVLRGGQLRYLPRY
jgi:hypothetical protein